MTDKKTKLTVAVGDLLLEVSIYQKSSVWVAAGEYKGEAIETTGASASAAVRHWQAAARRRGDVSTSRSGKREG